MKEDEMDVAGLNDAEQAQLDKLLAKREAGAYAQIEELVDGPIGQVIEQLKQMGALISDEATLTELRKLLNVLVHESPKLREAAGAAKAARA